MFAHSWRGVVGLVKATNRPGSLEEFIRLLPEGIGVIPVTAGIKEGTEKELFAVLEVIKEKIAELAKLNVDLIQAGGAPPFMIRGYQGEQEIIRELEEKHGIPVITPGIIHVEALKALKIRKMVGVSYFPGKINQKYAKYFEEAGFEVLGMEGMSVPFTEAGKLSPHEVYAFIKKQYLQHPEAEGIYMLGAAWRVLEVIQLLEQDLQVPVVHSVATRVWAIQKRLHVRQPMKGYGRLLEEMP